MSINKLLTIFYLSNSRDYNLISEQLAEIDAKFSSESKDIKKVHEEAKEATDGFQVEIFLLVTETASFLLNDTEPEKINGAIPCLLLEQNTPPPSLFFIFLILAPVRT